LTADTDLQSVLDAVGLTAIVNRQPVVDDNDSDSGSSSSSSDETNEAKRARLDPDYVPTASTSPLTTAGHSQEISEAEPDDTDTEESGSWHPSETTSPEIYSSPEDD
jgi:hypothetical protein